MFPCNAYYCPIACTALHFAQVLEIQNSFLWPFFFNLFHVVYIHKLYLIAICTYIPMFISHVHTIPLHISNCLSTSHIFILWIVSRSIKYLSIFWLHSSWWFPDLQGLLWEGSFLSLEVCLTPRRKVSVHCLLSPPAGPSPPACFVKLQTSLTKLSRKLALIQYDLYWFIIITWWQMINEYEWSVRVGILWYASLHIRGFCTDILFTVAEETQSIFRVPSLESCGYGYILLAPSS